MLKLNQAIALLKDAKRAGEKAATEANKIFQKAETFKGIKRSYRPIDDEGTRLPEENQKVRTTVPSIIKGIEKDIARMIDVVMTVDSGNMGACADIVVEKGAEKGILIKNVPAITLIFLEKKINDLITLIKSIPVLDVGEDWSGVGNNTWKTSVKTTTRTEKTLEAKVLYEATEDHPAQVQTFTVDKIVGYWDTTELSGAISIEAKEAMLNRANLLLSAVLMAREEANMFGVEMADVGNDILDYIFV